MANFSLQSGLAQVGTDAFFISFILVRESLNKGVYREVGTHPQNLRCLRLCLWLTPQLNIVDGQKIVGTDVGIAGETPLEDRNRLLIPPHLSGGPAFET